LTFAERVGVPSALLLLMIWLMEKRLDDLTAAVLAIPAQLAAEISKALCK
jgi:hypothetical protein